MSEANLDARNLLCPMPVIRTQNKIKTLAVGDTLTVVATDPGVKQDIPCWCRINGHRLVSITEENNDVILVIEKGR